MMFSVGMATYDDFDGVYFSAMSLLTHHQLVSEIIIIDNNPQGRYGQTLREFVQNGSGKLRYVPYSEATGTAQPRNEVFRQAKSDYVVCIDSHVLLLPGALEAVRDYYTLSYDSGDLIQGPLVMDNMQGLATHFEDVWNAEMWGVWGFDERARDGREVFDIPAQGLGVFACRKDKWLGFNPEFRGFGGEEWYIHEKFRKAGRRTVCASGFKWVHRFGRPNGVPYPLERYHRVRNYCIGLTELGIPLDRVKKHFAPVLRPGEWESAVRGDMTPAFEIEKVAATAKPCGCKGEAFPGLDAWYQAVKGAPSDINEHCDTLRELAAGKTVVDCGSRHAVSTVALGSAANLTVVSEAEPGEVKRLVDFGVKATHIVGTSLTAEVIPADLVFFDTVHTGPHVHSELLRWREAAQRMVIHDSVTFGEQGEHGQPGIMQGVREFLRANREWIVLRHDKHNNGLVILSRVPEDKKPLPSKGRLALNLLKAVTAHVVTGAKSVSHGEYEQRLSTCDMCPSRHDEQCGECGCYIAEKAKWKEQRCPLEKWA